MRRLPRTAERGAALFIVVLVIVLLTAIGVFAVHAASLAQAASGYSRRAAAAFYLSEFSMNVVASDMAAGKEVTYQQMALTGKNQCRGTAGLGGPTGLLAAVGAGSSIVPCLGIEFEQMKQLMDASIVSDADGPVFGALNRPDSPAEQIILGSFRVELTDLGPAPAPEAGMDVTSKRWQAALTSTGRIVPTTLGGGSSCSEDAARASESQTLRGYVTYTTVGTPAVGAP